MVWAGTAEQDLMPRAELPPVQEWRIHLGAHKTATTHIQETLAAIRDDLAMNGGVDALPLIQVREMWKSRVAALRKPEARLVAAMALGRQLDRTDASGLAHAIAPLRLGPPRILVSEENLMGDVITAIGTARPYTGMKPALRLRLLNALTGGAVQRHLFFCIRDMSQFLPSAYVEGLKLFRIPRPFEHAMARALASPPSWLPVVAQIRRAFPDASLTVWRYEDYQPNAREIIGWMAGADPGPLPEIARPLSTASPSTEAVRTVEAMQALNGFGPKKRHARVVQTFMSMPISPQRPVFRPVAPEIAARCHARYASDCSALAAQGLLRTPAGLGHMA